MKKLLLTAAILALTGLQQPAFAHGDEEHGDQPHEATAEMVAPSTAPEALTSIQTGMSTIGSQIETGKFNLIHEEIEKIDSAAKDLKSNEAVGEEKKARLESSVDQLIAQLGKLHTVTDGKEVVKTQADAEFKKAQGALKLLEAALK